MEELLKINEAANRYNVTKRALRYYEEIGILSSKRKSGSDYRYYDRETLDKLEQILLLKSLNFQISEIKEIILSKDEEFIDKILHNKLRETQKNIDALYDNKKVISAILKIKEKQGARGINFYEVIKEQIYIQRNMERVIDMNQYVGDMI